MKHYAKARRIGHVTGTEIEACGSDSVLPLRPGLLHRQIEAATEHFGRINEHLGKNFTGFNIYHNGRLVTGCAVH